MSDLVKIQATQEEFWSADEPVIEGEWIRNLLVLGAISKNSWNPAVDFDGKKRNYSKIIATESEYVKFEDVPAYILHKGGERVEEDKIGTFHNPRPSDKGLRMDLRTKENHPQIIALKDNIQHQRPFGGFSPRFDLSVNQITGVVESVDVAYSIDLVPNPATVKSAIEEVEEPKEKDEEKSVEAKEETDNYITKDEHNALCQRVEAMEVWVKAKECNVPIVAREEVIPEPQEKKEVNLFDYIRG